MNEKFNVLQEEDDPGPPAPAPLSAEELQLAIFRFSMSLFNELKKDHPERQARYMTADFLTNLGTILYTHPNKEQENANP